jgi:hypothetical protein
MAVPHRRDVARIGRDFPLFRRPLHHVQCAKFRNPWRGTTFSFSLDSGKAYRMKIVEHTESHIVKLDDGSTWRIFPGDIDRTLMWLPTTELKLFEISDEVASHALINSDDGTFVRVRPQHEQWPAEKVKDSLKQG